MTQFEYLKEVMQMMERFSSTSIKKISNDLKALLDTKSERKRTRNLLFCDGLFYTQLFP